MIYWPILTIYVVIKAIYLKLEKFVNVLQERHSKYEEDVLPFDHFWPNRIFGTFPNFLSIIVHHN